MNSAAIRWITGDDTGMSSKAIWAHMMGQPVHAQHDYPYDPADFGRCYRLLKLIPSWRRRIGEMAVYGPWWAALVARWDYIETLYEQEIGDKRHGMAHKTYDLIRAIRGSVDSPNASAITVA